MYSYKAASFSQEVVSSLFLTAPPSVHLVSVTSGPRTITMKLQEIVWALSLLPGALSAPSVNKRDEAKFDEGQPISADGKGGPILGE